MNTALQIAVVLSAVDQMSAGINRAVNASNQQLTEFARRQQNFQRDAVRGFAMMGTGQEMAGYLKAPISAYADLEKEQLALQSAFLKEGGYLDKQQFADISKEAIRLGNLLPGTTADFMRLFRTMKENGTDAETILNGTGEAAAYLAVQLQLPMDVAGQMAARLRQNFGLQGSEMQAFMDLLARIKQVGPDATEISFAFNKSAGAINSMQLSGIENVKAMGAIYAQLISAGGGFSGETAGTSMQSVLFELMDPKKVQAMQAAAANYGQTLNFFNANGSFAGMQNFIYQLDKLQGLTESEKFNVLSAIAGPQGKDMSLLLALTNQGAKGFNEMNRKLAEQADLQTKVGSQLQGLSLIWEATTGTFTNTQASFGKVLAPETKAIAENLGAASAHMQSFIENNPRLAKTAAYMFAAGSAVLFTAGAIGTMTAAWNFLGFTSGLSAMSYGLFALRYHLMFTLIPAVNTATASLQGMAAAMWTGPVAAAAAMSAALAGAAYSLWYVYQNWDQLKAGFEFSMQSPTHWIDPNTKNAIQDLTGFDLRKYDKKPDAELYKRVTADVKYMPTINFNGAVDKGTQDNFKEMLNQHSQHINEIVNKNNANNARLSFGADGAW